MCVSSPSIHYRAWSPVDTRATLHIWPAARILSLTSPLSLVNLLPPQSVQQAAMWCSPTCLNVSRKSKKFLLRLSLRCGATSIPTCNQTKQNHLSSKEPGTNKMTCLPYRTFFLFNPGYALTGLAPSPPASVSKVLELQMCATHLATVPL